MVSGRAGLTAAARRFVADTRGAVAVYASVVLPVLLLVGGFAVEAAWVRLNAAKLQVAADAGALAAVHRLPDTDLGTINAEAFAVMNAGEGVLTAADVRYGHWNGADFIAGDNPTNAAEVTTRMSAASGNRVATFFGSLLGLRGDPITGYDLTAQAVAAVDQDEVCSRLEDFPLGTAITDQITGMDVEAVGGANLAMVFDTANPTGGDEDLFSTTRGKVLIISEDGDGSDPDDNARGGRLIFTFDKPAFIGTLVALDTENGGRMTAFDDLGTVIKRADVPRLPDGTEAVVSMDVGDVARLEVELRGSGAFDDLCFGTRRSRAWLAR